MEGIDFSKIDAKVAYYDAENQRCRLNHIKCDGDDCRRCNFITDSSLMVVLDNIYQQLEQIKHLLGAEDNEECSCSCGCHQ